MRYQDQETNDTNPGTVTSDPVPVPPPDRDEPMDLDRDRDRGDETADDRAADDGTVTEGALVDRGTFDDPVAAGDQPAEDQRADEGEFDRTGGPLGAGATRDDSGFGHGDTDREFSQADAGDDIDRTDADLYPAEADARAETDRDLDRTDSDFYPAEADAGRTDVVAEGDADQTYYPGEADQAYYPGEADRGVDRTDVQTDRDEVVEPAPQPTAFGAATVGGAAAAAAMAGQARTDTHDVREEDTARTGDGAVADRLADTEATSTDQYAEAGVAADSDESLSTKTGPGVSVPPVAAADGQPVGEVAPAGGLMPGDVTAESVTTFFTPDASQRFRDQWREVQLGFVDDPRAAAGDAQRLVEEAMDALAAALSEQKQSLRGWDSGDADDTENLRVLVRRYREFLDRVIGL